MNIIDCHIHPAVDEETHTNFYGVVGDFDHQIKLLKKAGISQACGSVITRLEPDSFDCVRTLNDKALALRDQYPDFYIPGIHVHPQFPDESCAEIERCCGKHDVRWIGELVGYFMNYGEQYDTDNFLQIMKTVESYKAVVNFHCSDLTVIESLCGQAPGVDFVLAHPGGGKNEFLDRIEVVSKYANLYLDLSGSGIDRYGMVHHAVKKAGKDKILFGTDFPINNPAVYTHGITLESLTQLELNAIFHENFERLIG